jgi:hypothetical protein
MTLMDQHPVPQNVTSYQFRLVGDMTLKQFLELAGGIVLAWLIFSSKLNFLVKWTLGPFLGFLGFVLAFVPVQDRPLDQWLVSFIKSIYLPTQYVWKPTPTQLDFLAPRQVQPLPPLPASPEPEKVEEYLKSLPSEATTSFDKAETNYLNRITSLFSTLGLRIPSPSRLGATHQAPLATPIKGIRIRQLQTPQAYASPIPIRIPEPQRAAMPISSPPLVVKTIPLPKAQAKPSPKPAPAKATPVKPSPVKPTQPTPVAKTVPAPKPVPPPPPKASVSPVYATDVVIPQAQERPNLISGITVDQNNKIIPNVIIEIRNAKGHPVRALKSNKLGQFFIATPLPDGVYQIEAEHDRYRFAIIKIEAKNEIIPPLKIQAVS